MKKILIYCSLIFFSMSSSAEKNTSFEDLLFKFDEKNELSENFVKRYLKKDVYGQFFISRKNISENYIALEITNSTGVGIFNSLYTFTKSGEIISHLPLSEELDCDGGEWVVITSEWNNSAELSKTTTTIDSCYRQEFIHKIKVEFYRINVSGAILKDTKRFCPLNYYQILSSIKVSDLFLSELTKDQLRLYRNSIFAYHGYIFESPDLKSYFSACKWYKPSIEFSAGTLNEVEKFNIGRIKHFEGA